MQRRYTQAKAKAKTTGIFKIQANVIVDSPLLPINLKKKKMLTSSGHSFYQIKPLSEIQTLKNF